MWQCKIFARDHTMLGSNRVVSTEQELVVIPCLIRCRRASTSTVDVF